MLCSVNSHFLLLLQCLFVCVTYSAQPSGCNVEQLTFLPTKVGICTKRGFSQSHYILISHFSHQQVEGTEVLLLQANKASKRLSKSHHWIFFKGTPREIFPAVFVVIVVTGILIQNTWVLCLKVTGA